MLPIVSQVDKELASGEYFLKEKERKMRKQFEKRVRFLVTLSINI